MKVDSSLLLPSGTQLGEYTILSSLGQGGFGVTYLATDATSGQKVVLKENLPSDFSFRDSEVSLNVKTRNSSGDGSFEWAMNNFLNEAHTLASLDHPGIVKVLRAFAAFNTAYFVMPYVEGDSLNKYREKHGAPTEEWVRGTLRALLEALKYLHGKNLLHRDIKPANILLSKEGAPILIDFGTARHLLSEKSQTVIESPGYTPVEQMQSHGNVGTWTDLYALGATMYKLITGDTPPKNADRVGKYDPCTPLSKRGDLTQSYSAQLLAGIDKAMSVWPEDRWRNAEEWLEWLATNGASLQVLQRENSVFGEKIRQMQEEPKKKSRSLTPLYMAMGCVLLVLVIVGINLFDHEKTASDLAETNNSSLGVPLSEPMAHVDMVYSVGVSPDGSRIVTGSRDKTICIWNAVTKRKLKSMEHEGSVRAVSFSPDGSKIVSGSWDKTICIWDAETGQKLQSMKHDDAVYSVSFSADGSKIVFGSLDNTICIRDAQTGEKLQSMVNDASVTSVSFSPDGSKIVSGSSDNTIRIWNAQTGQKLRNMKHEGEVRAVSFSPDGRRIVSGSVDKTIRIWDAETGQELQSMKHDGAVNSVSYSLDGRRIVSGSVDKTIRIWDAETGRKLKSIMSLLSR